MAESNINVMLDTVKKNRNSMIYGVENDYKARFITARIMADGQQKAVQPTAAITINAFRPDGQARAFVGSVNADGTVKVPVTQWMLEVEGEVECSISITTSESKLTTTPFTVQATKSLWVGSEPSPDDPNYDVIVQIIASEKERVAAETQRVADEATRVANEKKRVTDEATRVSNENTRVSNETGRVNAEEFRATEFATWKGEIGKVSALDKRVTNLEAGIPPENFVTDDTVAYAKDVPANVLPFAEIKKIGGMTYKSKNYFDISKIPRSDNNLKVVGDTIEVVSESSNSAISCTTSLKNLINVNVGETIYYNAKSSTENSNQIRLLDARITLYGGKSYKITQEMLDSTVAFYGVEGSTTTKNVVSDIIISKENVPYEPHFDGLRDSKTTAVESVGVNLIPFPYEGVPMGTGSVTSYGVTFTVLPDGSINIKGKSTKRTYSEFVFGSNFKTNTSSDVVLNFIDKNNGTVNKNIYLVVGDGDYTYNEIDLGTSAVLTHVENPSNIFQYCILRVKPDAGNVDITVTAMLNKGKSALPYSPYQKSTLPIPAAVQALEGYGASAKLAKNYTDFTNKKYIVEVHSTQITAATSVSILSSGSFYFDCPQDAKKASSFMTNVICAKADAIYRGFTGYYEEYFILDDKSISTVEEFHAKYDNEIINYEIETPTVTDISSMLSDDNLVGVEGGGTVTAVNEFEQPTPWTIEYQLKGAK